MEEQILVTNIQRFSLHDGPGIRTTVFLKGCSLRCPWCANPENIEPYPESYVKDGREGTYGRHMTCDEVYDEVMKDRIFYGEKEREGALAGMPGGVTFSGGEPLMQAKALELLMERLKGNGVHVCAETALFVPGEQLDRALLRIDLFYVDVKILNSERCRAILHGDLRQYEGNVERLFCADRAVVFRVPVIGGYTDSEENQKEILSFFKRFKPLKVELIKEHNLGQSKYHSLKREPLTLNTVTDEAMQRFKEEIELQTGIETEICKI